MKSFPLPRRTSSQKSRTPCRFFGKLNTKEESVNMLTDIEIAQQCAMKPITEIASELNIRPEELEPYGHYKAKLSDSLFDRLADRPNGKLVLVTAINPTPGR